MSTTTLTGLTTIFTPPASCSSSWTYENEFYNSIQGGLLLQNAVSLDMDTDCFPPGYGYVGRVHFPTEVFSPGACPAEYVTATLSFNGDTTLAVCCQSGFTYTSTFSLKDQFNSTTVLFAGCTSVYPSDNGSTVVPARDDQGLTLTTVTGPIIMWGQPISVEFQQKDLTLFTTSTNMAMPTAQPSKTATQPVAGPTSSVPDLSAEHNGLSSGAAAGLAVAVAICGLGIIAGIILLMLRRRRAKMKNQLVSARGESGYQLDSQRQELDAASYDKSLEVPTLIQEADGRNITSHPGSKLSTSTPRVELE